MQTSSEKWLKIKVTSKKSSFVEISHYYSSPSTSSEPEVACELHSGVEMWLEFKREGATRGSHRIYKQRICEKRVLATKKKTKRNL